MLPTVRKAGVSKKNIVMTGQFLNLNSGSRVLTTEEAAKLSKMDGYNHLARFFELRGTGDPQVKGGANPFTDGYFLRLIPSEESYVLIEFKTGEERQADGSVLPTYSVAVAFRVEISAEADFKESKKLILYASTLLWDEARRTDVKGNVWNYAEGSVSHTLTESATASEVQKALSGVLRIDARVFYRVGRGGYNTKSTLVSLVPVEEEANKRGRRR